MMTSNTTILELDPHIMSLLADPVTQQPATAAAFREINGVLDARIFLKKNPRF